MSETEIKKQKTVNNINKTVWNFRLPSCIEVTTNVIGTLDNSVTSYMGVALENIAMLYISIPFAKVPEEFYFLFECKAGNSLNLRAGEWIKISSSTKTQKITVHSSINFSVGNHNYNVNLSVGTTDDTKKMHNISVIFTFTLIQGRLIAVPTHKLHLVL
jgi:hypothetical protein